MTTSWPPGYPTQWESDVVLSDGHAVHVRPIRPDDGERLVAFHQRLSPDTVYRRFFSPHPRLSEDEVRRFTNVDYRERLALVALQEDELIAVARYDRLDGTDDAEVAFVVNDANQGRGIATVLLEHLAAAARGQGVGRFVADTLASNTAMLSVFRSAGFEEKRTLDQGVIRVTFPIAPTDEYQAAVDDRERRAQEQSIGRILRPRSIAVVGAGRRPATIGHEVLRNLIDSRFSGELFPVNRNGADILGLPAYPSLAALPTDVDLVIVAVPPADVPGVVAEAAARHAHALVIITAGFAEMGESGATTERRIVEEARHAGMRVVGPNCIGIVNTDPEVSMNATFAPTAPQRGRAALSSQSGAVGIAMLDRAARRGLGVSSFVSVGNKSDVSGNDLVQYWETDPSTDVVLLYLESFGNPRKFARVARRVSRSKPIIAVKSGRSAAGRRAAQSHTASAASPDVAVDALFRQAGIIRVDTLPELFDTALVLAGQPLPAGRRVGIVGNSGGPGILAADACEAAGLELPALSEATRAALHSFLPPEASVANPVDLVASAGPDSYRTAVQAVLADPSIDAVLVIFTATLVTTADAVAEVIAETTASAKAKPLLACFLGRDDPPAALSRGARTVPTFPFPEPAVFALARAQRYGEWRARPLGARPSFEGIDRPAASRVVSDALGRDPAGGWLDASEAAVLVSSYGISLARTIVVTSAGEAAEAANMLGGPVALKAASGAIVHKSDVGGVRLNITSPAEAGEAFDAMAAALGPAMGGAIVQPMVPPGVETIIGVVDDPLFGPLVMFGLGGVATDLLGDRGFRILPLTDLDAAELIDSVRAAPLLHGYRGAPSVDVGALQDMLLHVAQLAEDIPEIAEMDLNPVVVSALGATAVDVKIRISPAAQVPDPTVRRMRPAGA